MGRTNRTIQSLLLLAVFCATAASLLRASDTQNSKGNWDNLKQLAPGTQIRVVLNDAKSYLGQLQAVSDEAIVVRLATGEQAFPRATVLRVSSKGESHRKRNALAGAVIGGAAGAALGAYGGAHSDVGAGAGAGVIALLFAPVGGGIGALMPTGGWRDVYRAR